MDHATMQHSRLLILDDDYAVGQTIAFVSEAMGMETRSVSRPNEFFDLVDHWQPTHIAVDLVMPEMDGVEVLRLLADRNCRARIIISSGVGGRVLDAARRSAAERGLDIAGVLSKPFSTAALRRLLAEGGHDAAPTGRPAAAVRREFDVTEAELRIALDQQQLQLAYQPKIACATGVLTGFEALVRWHHPQQGVIMPDRFIPLAESSGLIDPLTEQVFEAAIRWLSTYFPVSTLCLSVNISAKSLADFHLADHVFALCQRFGIQPGRLIFELTETSAMDDPVTSLDLLTRLRMKGFQLSIDDFGTGYSSMVQLVRLPFSEIKVDKSFVMAAAQSQESRTVVKSVVDLGHSLGLLVTAEGVEDASVLDFLSEIGCDQAQGYLIARPIAGHAVTAWVEDWQKRQPAAKLG